MTDCHGGEKLDQFNLEAGDITVADGGYGYRSSIATVKEKQADGVFRIHPNTFPVEDRFGEPIDLWKHLRQTKGEPILEIPAYCVFNNQRYPVRIIACRLPPKQAGIARKRAKKRGRPVSQNSLVLAGWVVLVTTLDETNWSAEDVLRLYRVRWQIELLFKRIKQHLDLHLIRCQRQDAIQATIRALLVAWVLQEQQAASIRAFLEQIVHSALTQNPALPVSRPVSSWTVSKLCLITLRNHVLGHWSMARIRECLPRLQRFLTTKPLKRGHQESDTRKWLIAHLIS